MLAANPPVVNAQGLVDHLAGARVIACGDSFAVLLPGWARALPSITRVWPFPAWAWSGGAVNGAYWHASGVARRIINHTRYASGANELISLPVGGIAELASGFTYRYGLRQGNAVRTLTTPHLFRPIMWNNRVLLHADGINIEGVEIELAPFDTEIFYALPDVTIGPDHTADVLCAAGCPRGTVFMSAGGIIYTPTRPQGGIYYQTLADPSWSYAGFGDNRAPEDPFDKVFERRTLASYLEATTLDPLQPMVFFWHFAQEEHPPEEYTRQFTNMLDVADGACQDAGLPAPRHVLITPMTHEVNAQPFDVGRPFFEAAHAAAAAIARSRAHVTALSIYHLTSGLVFDGSEAAIDWLDAHNYDADLATTAGELLSADKLHPADAAGADALARIIWDGLRRGDDPGDFDGNGMTNIFDIFFYFDRFGAASPIADLAEPGGLDIRDVFAFFDGFGG